MTTTIAYSNKPTATATDVAIKMFDQSDLELRQNSYDPKTNAFLAEYVLNDGDRARPTTVSAIARVNKDLSVFYSLKVRTYRTVTVDSVIKEDEPADFNISWSQASLQDDITAVLAMLGAAYGLLMDGVTTKIPNEGVIGKFNLALVTGLYE